MEEWPEQMILFQINERCEALLGIASSAPIARMLAAIELLLPVLEDWEGYASRETSLRDHQSKLVELIVSWRGLELHSWARLLQSQEAKFLEPVAEWWFRLYELIPRAVAISGNTTSPQDVSFYLDSLISLLETLFTGSPVGQFSERLELVRTFARLAALLDDSQTPLFRTLASIFDNTYHFYQQKNLDITNYLSLERTKIEKQVKDVISLATWKDVNIYALKQSALKSHRQLYKCVRKLRTLLELPASTFLNISTPMQMLGADMQEIRLSQAMPARPILQVPLVGTSFSIPTSNNPAAVIDIGQTILRLQSILTRSADQFSLWEGPVESLSHTIIARSLSLQNKLSTGKTREEIVKSVAGLTNQKRKAWSDLLKELRRIGLSHRPKSTITARHTDSSFLYQTFPFPATFFSNYTLLSSAQSYFYGLVASLPALRKFPSSHHDDISSNHLQLAVGSIESCFAIILSDRCSLQAGLEQGHHIQGVLAHLRTLCDDSGLSNIQPLNPIKVFEQYLSTFHNISDSLDETVKTIERHVRFSDTDSDRLSAATCVQKVVECNKAVLENVTELDRAFAACRPTELLGIPEITVLQRAFSVIAMVSESVEALTLSHPRFAYLTGSLSTWIKQEKDRVSALMPSIARPTSAPEDDLLLRGDPVKAQVDFLSAVLVIFQDIHEVPIVPAIDTEGDFVDDGMSCRAQFSKKRLGQLRMPIIRHKMDHLLQIVKKTANSNHGAQLGIQLLAR